MLKTLGLAQIMGSVRSAILADKGSRVGIFSQFCRRGDEQSIEQSLSFLQSHDNIVSILRAG